MNPGSIFVRSFLSKDDSLTEYPDTLTIYDRGNVQGYLIQSAGKTTKWVVFQVDYRILQADSIVIEGGELLSESEAPFQYFSIETYPLKQEQLQSQQLLFSLPQAQILLTLAPPPSLELPQPPSQQRQLLPSPSQLRANGGSVSRGSLKSGSSRPTGGQRSSQNKSKASPKSTVLPSSNPGFREQPLSQAPRKQEQHPLQLTPTHHTDRESPESPPWTSLSQQSPYSQPPPEVAKEFSGQASTSRYPKGSGSR